MSKPELPLDMMNESVAAEAPPKKTKSRTGSSLAFAFLPGVLACFSLGGYIYWEYAYQDNSELIALKARVETQNNTLLEMDFRVDSVSNVLAGEHSAVTGLKSELEQLRTSGQFRSANTDSQLAAIEERLSDLEASWKKHTAPKPRAKKKRVAKKKAYAPSAPSLSVVSIRSAGGRTMVHVQDMGGNVSPLLREGDIWSGWKFVGADGRTALFEVKGKTRELAL